MSKDGYMLTIEKIKRKASLMQFCHAKWQRKKWQNTIY